MEQQEEIKEEKVLQNDPSSSKKHKDPFVALDHQLKNQLSEIITLRKIRDDQFKTIGELRNEIFNLKREVEKLNEI